MRDNGETVVIVARQHTSARHAGEACPIVMAGLDPAIHLLREEFLRRRWTRGSSPRVTGEVVVAAPRHCRA
jgi:hypothetical protein